MIAADAKIGYPPTRVWGVPARRYVGPPARRPAGEAAAATGDCLSGTEAAGGASRSRPRAQGPRRRTEVLVQRIAPMPLNQLMMVKLAAQLHADRPGRRDRRDALDRLRRHLPHAAEGYAFQRRAAEVGFRRRCASATRAVRRRRFVDQRGLSNGRTSTQRCRSGWTRPREIVAAARALIAERATPAARSRSSPTAPGWPPAACTATSPTRVRCFARSSARPPSARSTRSRRRARSPADRQRFARAVETFARRALKSPDGLRADRRAVRPQVKADASSRRRAYSDIFAQVIADAVDAGELPAQDPRSRRRPSSAPWPRPWSFPSTPGSPPSARSPTCAFIVRSLGATHANP